MFAENNLLISFIVPCYNVERYIQKCLDSIYVCDLQESQFEVICVNDCSPDNVQSVLEQNQKQHDNLKIVVHEYNKGLGGARNTGINNAKGKFVWFVDADDSIIGKGVNNMVSRADESNADVFCFNYRRQDESGNELSKYEVFQDTPVQDGISFVQSVFGNNIVYHMGYVWRFLYRTDYLRLHQLFFPENVCWEDTVYIPKALLEADRVGAVNSILYSYRVNPESISGGFVKTYPAKLIFEYAFCAGGDLLRFSENVKEEGLKKAFHDRAVRYYINGFPIHLFRTSRQERKKFNNMIRTRNNEVKALKNKMKMFNKLLLLPVIGPVMTETAAMVYRFSHKNKR